MYNLRGISPESRWKSYAGGYTRASPPGFMADAEWDNPKNTAAEKLRQQQEDNIFKIFQKLYSQFVPANNIRESDIQISSDELFNKIHSHYPSEVLSFHLIYDRMLEAGFKFECFPGKVEFVWLLKKKPNETPDVLSWAIAYY